MTHERRYRINAGHWLTGEEAVAELVSRGVSVTVAQMHVIVTRVGNRHYLGVDAEAMWLHCAWSDDVAVMEVS